MNQKTTFFRGLKDGVPICLGYISVSFAFGIFAVENGLTPLQALIISMMTGKAISNFIREKNAVTTVLVIGCSLFLFSDLMLCASWFMDTGRITSILCMVAYYPAEILLAHSVYHHAVQK